jgi:hypothetical protein
MELETYSVHVPVVVGGRNAVRMGRVFRLEFDAVEAAAVVKRASDLGVTPGGLVEELFRGLLRA